MSVDVKVVEDLREGMASFRSQPGLDEGDRQLVDATLAMLDEQLMLLESDD